MNRIVLLSLLAGAWITGAVADDVEQRTAASRATAKSFMESLKGELVPAMKSGGPIQAIQVCKVKAPGIAEQAGAAKGWRVGRTSLRTRNPENAPDAWELAVLEQFETRKQAGESPASLEHHEVVERDGRRYFRYMKAIPTGKVCLTCHGSHIDPTVAAELDKLYPEDKARGFEEGDIRGAFTIIQPM